MNNSLTLAMQGRVRQGSSTNQWYGVERDMTIASPDWTRIASSPSAMDLHKTLPAHNQLKGVVLKADKTINYYLKPNDWTQKADGSASTLTGADGNVMIRKDKSLYWKFEQEGNIQRVKVSLSPLQGFSEKPVWNLGAYEGKLVATKLSSVKGVLPTTSRSETQFRIDARANGTGYEQLWYDPYMELCWLYMIEYATSNFQKAIDQTLTIEGYKKGGLGNGITTAVSAEWSAFNGYNPFVTCGATDGLGNGSGEVSVIIPNFGGAGINKTFTPNRYRGIENLFGHIWKWVDGVTINHLADRSEAYIFDNPAQFADNTSINGRLSGLIPMAEGWVKTILFGSKGDILPASIGGSSTTQMCDYFYRPTAGSGWKALVCGCSASSGSTAGGLAANANNGASSASTGIGARLFAR